MQRRAGRRRLRLVSVVGGARSAQRGEHAVDHHARLAEVVGRVAQLRERGPVEVLVDLGVLGQQVEQRAPRIPDFDEVKDKVRAAVKNEKANTQLEQKAKDIAAAAKSPGDLKAAAGKAGLEAKAEANYKLATPLGEAGSSVVIDDPLYAAKAGDVLQPIFLNQNYLVIGVNKKTDADLTEYAKQRDSLMQQALTDRKNQVFGDYLTSVMLRMKRSGSIKIYQDVLDTVAEEEPQALPQRRPQLPITK